MSLSFYGKRPGPGVRLDKLSLQFAMHDTGLLGEVLEAYERLILDAMRGDHTLFNTAEGIERLWQVPSRCSKLRPPSAFTRQGRGGRSPFISSSLLTPGGCRSSGRGGIRIDWAAEPPWWRLASFDGGG
jgi:glucose-6-phosphate 1-dehydrogenase